MICDERKPIVTSFSRTHDPSLKSENADLRQIISRLLRFKGNAKHTPRTAIALTMSRVRTMKEIAVLTGARGLYGHAEIFRHDRLRFLIDAMRAGPLVRVRFFHRSIVLVNDAECAHELMVERAKQHEKTDITRLLLEPLGGEGLFTSRGELWRKQRRVMAPIFQQQQVRHFAEAMLSCAKQGLRQLEEAKSVDVAHLTMQIAMSVVGKTLFDAETFDEADVLGDALTTTLQWVNQLAGSVPLVSQVLLRQVLEQSKSRWPVSFQPMRKQLLHQLRRPVGFYWPSNKRVRDAVTLIDARIQRMIQERRESHATHNDLLSQLLRARDQDDGKGMSDKQVRDEAVTLFVAGHETTATSLAWSLYELARKPEILAQVEAEADAFFTHDSLADAHSKLPTCLRAFKEALRLYPPVMMMPRQTTSSMQLGGHEIPEGTLVIVNLYGLQRNPKYYDAPEDFRPDRFLPEEENARHRYAWLPFGAGPRTCIGNSFAMLEGQLVLATLAHHARFLLNPGQVVEAAPLATLRPKGGMPMRVALRKH